MLSFSEATWRSRCWIWHPQGGAAVRSPLPRGKRSSKVSMSNLLDILSSHSHPSDHMPISAMKIRSLLLLPWMVDLGFKSCQVRSPCLPSAGANWSSCWPSFLNPRPGSGDYGPSEINLAIISKLSKKSNLMAIAKKKLQEDGSFWSHHLYVVLWLT